LVITEYLWLLVYGIPSLATGTAWTAKQSLTTKSAPPSWCIPLSGEAPSHNLHGIHSIPCTYRDPAKKAITKTSHQQNPQSRRVRQNHQANHNYVTTNRTQYNGQRILLPILEPTFACTMGAFNASKLRLSCKNTSAKITDRFRLFPYLTLNQ
jgi:hypothetical protein